MEALTQIPRRAGDIPEPVGDAPRHRPGMSPLVGDIPDAAGDIPERPGISPTRPGTMSPAAGDTVYPRRGVGDILLAGYPRAVRGRPRLLAALKTHKVSERERAT